MSTLSKAVMAYMGKMKGQGRSPLKAAPANAWMGFAGGSVAIGLLGLLTEWSSEAWIMAPFGASCVLAFGLWDAPLSQPRNIVGGHVVSAFVGLAVYHLLGGGPVCMALAVGLAIAAMILTKTTHPPAGANPLVVMMAGSDWSFLLAPVLLGAASIAALALIVNNLNRKRRYPTFWF